MTNGNRIDHKREHHSVSSYQTYPIKSVLEVAKIVKVTRERIEFVIQPCLMIQSTHDHISVRKNLEKIYDKIGSKNKEKIYVKRVYHTFISDIKNSYVFDDILKFIKNN